VHALHAADLEKRQHGPKPVLFPHMVGPAAERLLAADAKLACRGQPVPHTVNYLLVQAANPIKQQRSSLWAQFVRRFDRAHGRVRPQSPAQDATADRGLWPLPWGPQPDPLPSGTSPPPALWQLAPRTCDHRKGLTHRHPSSSRRTSSQSAFRSSRRRASSRPARAPLRTPKVPTPKLLRDLSAPVRRTHPAAQRRNRNGLRCCSRRSRL
jgi:hypothetical protein